MLDTARIRHPAPYIGNRGKLYSSSIFRYPASSLNPPKIDDIPVAISPKFPQFFRSFQKLAKIILHINPSCKCSWKTGSGVDRIIDDIKKKVIDNLSKFSRESELSDALFEIVCVDDDIYPTHITVTASDNVFVIYYTEALEWVKSNVPRMVGLFNEAIKVVGAKAYTWEDMRDDYTERFREMSGDDDDDYKERVKEYKAVGPKVKGRFFGRGNTLNRVFQNKVKKFIPLSSKEKELYKWLNCVAEYGNTDTQFSFVNDYADSMPFHYIFPLLYSREDVIAEDFAEDFNSTIQSIGGFGVQLSYCIGDDMGEFDRFLGEIKVLGLYEKVFGFFMKLLC
jgi:hypothetical protein